MSEVKDVLNELYTKFLLRDFFAKIIPGLIFSLTIYWCLYLKGWIPQLELSNIEWTILIGFSWIIAFAIQAFGELIHTVKYYDNRYANELEWYNTFNSFLQKAKPNEIQNFERLVVIKEACGNLSATLILSTIFIFLFASSRPEIMSNLAQLLEYWPVVIVLLFAIVLLEYMHNIHVKRQCNYVASVLSNSET